MFSRAAYIGRPLDFLSVLSGKDTAATWKRLWDCRSCVAIVDSTLYSLEEEKQSSGFCCGTGHSDESLRTTTTTKRKGLPVLYVNTQDHIAFSGWAGFLHWVTTFFLLHNCAVSCCLPAHHTAQLHCIWTVFRAHDSLNNSGHWHYIA